MGDRRQSRVSGIGSSDPAQAETVDASATSEPEAPAWESRRSVGRYVVLQEVGRGGMGRVLRAYDPKLQREVALKQVRQRGVGDEMNRRLVIEARAMAKLSHANVVAVYDVEQLHGGEVVLVMEYLAGTTLRQWLDDNDPSWQDVLRRLVEAGRGLAAAHEGGLLHRDFKPTNVLVTEQSTKVTDFGLAKPSGTSPGPEGIASADNAAVAVESFTERGVVMGTPRYMAPEQHEGKELTAAADQYSFCVALWESLCGRPPFTRLPLAECKRAGPPTWRVSHVPRSVGEALRRGLSPDPHDRWPSMNALLKALERTAVVRRNNKIVMGSTIVVAVLGAASWAAWTRARSERCSGASGQLRAIWDDARRVETKTAFTGTDARYAGAVWNRLEEKIDGYARDWIEMYTAACEATTVRAEQSEEAMDLRMGCLHRAKMELEAAVGVLATADAEVVRRAHRLLDALPPLEQCADVEALKADVRPPGPGQVEAVEIARARLAEAKAERHAGRYESALARVAAAREALAGVGYEPALAELKVAHGNVLMKLGEFDAAARALRQGQRLAARRNQRALLAEATTTLLYVVGYWQGRMSEGLALLPVARGLVKGPRAEANLINSVAVVLREQGNYEQAAAEHRHALRLLEAALGPDHPDIATSRNNLAGVLFAQGKYEEAETEQRRAVALQEQALGVEHPDVGTSIDNLGSILHAQGKYEEAEVEHRKALEMTMKALGREHPDVAASRNNLASVLHAQGKYQEAEAEQRRALKLMKAALGPEHFDVARAHNNVGLMLDAQGKYQEAEVEYRRALALKQTILGPAHPDVAGSRNNLANVLYAQGRYEEAEQEHRAALVLREKHLGGDHPDVAASHHNLALVLSAQEKYEEAEAEERIGLALREKAFGPDHPDVATSRDSLASVLLARGRPKEALEFAEAAWQRRQHDDIPPERRAQTAFVLARALFQAGRDRTRARRLAERAFEEFRAAGRSHRQRAAEVEQWMKTHFQAVRADG